MDSESFSEKVLQNKSNLLAIAVVTIFAIASFFLTRPVTGSASVSSISGLMSLQIAAREAMPYQEAVTNQQPTLIEFYADWCTTCQAMASTIDAVHQQFDAEVNFVMLNIDEPQWQKQIETFKVSGVPHFVLLNRDQSVADNFVGKVPLQILANRMTTLLS